MILTESAAAQVCVSHFMDEQSRAHAQAGVAAPRIPLHCTHFILQVDRGGCNAHVDHHKHSNRCSQPQIANRQPPNTLAATSAFTTSPWYRPQRAPPLALQCNLPGFCCVCVLRAFSLLRQDMYFGTCTDNRTYEVGAHVATLQRAADADGHDVFVFTPRQAAAVAGVQSQETTK
jgi:hypothetical protein